MSKNDWLTMFGELATYLMMTSKLPATNILQEANPNPEDPAQLHLAAFCSFDTIIL
jgi:hypothetical protein